MVVKSPPTYKVSPEIARAFTFPLADGLKAEAEPEVELKTANFALTAPPIFPKLPPTYNKLPCNDKALIELSAFGFQPVATALVAFTCAILFLVTEPFTVVKSPPK